MDGLVKLVALSFARSRGNALDEKRSVRDFSKISVHKLIQDTLKVFQT